ncbi:MAG: hypothetical protein KJ698_10970 [Actinobacteria bacterium]|nr:hypothetical protein [Actinomycetota bacterium]MBU1494857.1 hypothetical protein [Actinomycetota bacterium]MBU1866017.1 hypothetical protein [Actinomycetota bacterium]
MHPLILRLHSLHLPRGDWALFGSGPLLLRGWIDDVGDLDVICREAAWEHAKAIGEPGVLQPDGVEIVNVDGGAITIGTSWRYGDIAVSDLIDDAEEIEGIPCVRLEHIVAYKRTADRPKDRVHLQIIEQRSAGGPR